jgi:hypothetical protein
MKRLNALVLVPVALVLTGTFPAGQTSTVAPRSPAATAPAAKAWTAPRTAEGQPDLQGVWDYRSATPLERPREFAGKEFLTDQEVADVERRAKELELKGRAQSIHPVWWLDYGTNVVGTRRSSLVVDPPDGRVPPMTPEAQKREADRRAEAAQFGPVDAPENRNLWERCVTREMPEAMLPGPYNSNIRIVQSQGYVVIVMEMIHDARIIPLDGRPHLPASIRTWLGDPRGRWEGNTLVVETTNFSDKTNYRGSGANLRLVERFTRVAPDVLQYQVTLEDPTTWTRPWTIEVPMVRSDGEMYEYACHEGNYGLKNMLTNARAAEQEAAAKGK